MSRTSMSSLISLARDLIGDPAGTGQVFSGDQIERALDVHRWTVRYLALTPIPLIVSGNTEYREWQSDEQNWEADAAVYNTNYQTLTPTLAEPLTGRWTFSTHQDLVLLSGQTYDIYGAAADLLEMWAAKAAIEIDFEADGARFAQSQKGKALTTLAATYRKLQRIGMVRQVRNDIEP